MARLTRNPCAHCHEETIHNGMTCTRCGITRPPTPVWGASKQFILRRGVSKPRKKR